MGDDCEFPRLIEMIENAGCRSKHITYHESGLTIHHYLSANGSTTEQIIDDGDSIEKETVLAHLDKLEVFHIAAQLFPPQQDAPQ